MTFGIRDKKAEGRKKLQEAREVLFPILQMGTGMNSLGNRQFHYLGQIHEPLLIPETLKVS